MLDAEAAGGGRKRPRSDSEADGAGLAPAPQTIRGFLRRARGGAKPQAMQLPPVGRQEDDPAAPSPVSAPTTPLVRQGLSPMTLAGIAAGRSGRVVYLAEPPGTGNTPLPACAGIAMEMPPCTPIEDLFALAPRGGADGAEAFLTSLREEQDLHTLGDVNALSNELFSHLAALYESKGFSYDLWEVLEGVRVLPDGMAIETALAKFGVQLPPPQLATVQRALLCTVRDLRRMKFGAFLTLPLPGMRWHGRVAWCVGKKICPPTSQPPRRLRRPPASQKPNPTGKLKATLQLIRERRRYARAEHPYEVIELPHGANAQMNAILGKLVDYHTGVDPSWRKSEKSQIVATAITYAKGCTCRKINGRAADPEASPNSPRPYPTASKKAIATAGGGADPWCTCPRDVVYSVNYELSTPSGSRCSEQNGLGQLAGMGVATSAIREVYVFGVSAAGAPDPNPLFPCGVCENMFRKLSKEVHRMHGGEIVLYMLASAASPPTKLIAMPFSEISNRASQGFKFFVETEVNAAPEEPTTRR
eukprot:TRINITY_DN18443_c0_g1_i2.p1 TRINITY_DN18443_c0_g1~~TRINITY_DN18443_c0_g1_i2.p1  ORF type:complete len:531 (+),score=127.58 TRINITY_DN18443_c0_g1_i2:57-1649(+)